MFSYSLHKSLSSLTPSRTRLHSANMSSNFVHPSQPVFMLESDRNHPKQQQYFQQQMPRPTEPTFVPCWTFPPARTEKKRRGWGGMNVGMAWVLTLILLLVFAALGLGAYQILKLKTEVEDLKQKELSADSQTIAPQKQVGLNPRDLIKTKEKSAAHLIGRADQSSEEKTLKWEANLGEAFTRGVKYSNGGLQVNETGLYFVYSRVEFRSLECNPTDSHSHTLFLRRNGRNRTIMEDHREGFCTAGRKQPWMTGSHLGSIHLLKESDWLFVNVSHPKLLSKNFHSNYFGFFKIQ